LEKRILPWRRASRSFVEDFLNGKEDDEKVELTKIRALLSADKIIPMPPEGSMEKRDPKSPQATQKKALTRESQRGG
jgi:hypothetical protein